MPARAACACVCMTCCPIYKELQELAGANTAQKGAVKMSSTKTGTNEVRTAKPSEICGRQQGDAWRDHTPFKFYLAPHMQSDIAQLHQLYGHEHSWYPLWVRAIKTMRVTWPPELTSPPFREASFFSFKTKKRANRAMMLPCPQSPNMTAKRNGNVMMVYGAEQGSKRQTDMQSHDTQDSNRTWSFHQSMVHRFYIDTPCPGLKLKWEPFQSGKPLLLQVHIHTFRSPAVFCETQKAKKAIIMEEWRIYLLGLTSR